MELQNQVESIRESLRRINRAAGSLKQDPFEIGLSHSQCHALLDIGREGPLTASCLVERLELDKSTVSRLVADLLKQRLITAKSMSHDRRHKSLELSAAGRKLIKLIDAKSNSTVLSCFKHLSAYERDEVVLAFFKAAEAIDRPERVIRTHQPLPHRTTLEEYEPSGRSKPSRGSVPNSPSATTSVGSPMFARKSNS